MAESKPTSAHGKKKKKGDKSGHHLDSQSGHKPGKHTHHTHVAKKREPQ